MFTLLLELNVICDQRSIQFELQNSPSRAFAFDGNIYITIYYRLPMTLDHNQIFWYFQNNHIKTTNIFSARSSPDPQILKKIAVRSSPGPAKIGFSPVQSWTVFSSGWHTSLRTLNVRQCDRSWRTHIWYTPVHPISVVHPWKIMVHPGVYDTPGWQALL